MKIAIVGVRGIPALYGGPETCAEQIAVRLAERGHEVVAYCRPGYWDDSRADYKGVRRVVLPTLKTTATDTFAHTFVSMWHIVGSRPDVVMAFNPGIALLCVLPRLRGIPVVLNPDGFDWRRAKWGRFARFFIKNSAWFSGRICAQLITDSISVRDYYNEEWACDPPALYIPYGAAFAGEGGLREGQETAILERYGVEPRKYFLFMSRHVPENTCETFIEGFRGLDTPEKLLFAGTGDTEYAARLRDEADDRVLMPGLVREEDVEALHRNSVAVLHGNQVGGTSLGLLKAMGWGCCVITLDTPDNVAVAGDVGYTFSAEAADVTRVLAHAVANPDERRRLGELARERVRDRYDWEDVADQYEEVFARVTAKAL